MVDLSETIKDALKEWNVRIFILVSLLLQILLIMFASNRKRNTSKAFNFFIWSIYLLADWVAGFTLGLLYSSLNDSDCDGNKGSKMKPSIFSSSKHKPCHNYNDNLLAFWAPFLLLHLGGPDTITAFAMEDNSLWPRHLIRLLFQVGTAIYIFLLSLPNNKLWVPTLLMFLTGIIKYSERTYALYLASFDVFRDSVLSGEEHDLANISAVVKSIENFRKDNGNSRVGRVQAAHKLFVFFKGIIVDHSDIEFYTRISNIFPEWTGTKVFELIECELSFLYDVLFTKAALVHTYIGYALRFLCSCLIMAAFNLFFLSKKHELGNLDIVITYTLLGGAICLDALAYIILILSNWTVLRLDEFPIISRFIVNVPPRNEWSGSMMQYNFIKSCLPQHGSYLQRIVDHPSFIGKVGELLCIQRLFRKVGVDIKLFDELDNSWREPVTDELKEFFFQKLKEKINAMQHSNKDDLVSSFLTRGRWTLERRGQLDDFYYSIEVRFDHSILMWHIATDLCYYTDEEGIRKKENSESAKHCRLSKLISNYMLYLLIMRPSMIPSVGSWHEKYRKTCTKCKDIFRQMGLNKPKSNPIAVLCISQGKRKQEIEEFQQEACSHLYYVKTLENLCEGEDEDSSNNMSFLPDGRALAEKLKKLEAQKRWEMMNEIWVEMLQYAANHCPGIAHAQALSKGGELLTFLRFVITHMGVEELSFRDARDYIVNRQHWIGISYFT